MNDGRGTERFETVIIGGGQAGLAVGYHLARRGLAFVILDAHQRISYSWRNRWDSLRLFTPARYNGLDGMAFPGPAHSFSTKDEVADYLESYAARFDLPVRTGVKVNGLSKGTPNKETFVVTAGERRFEADSVVVAWPPIKPPGCLCSHPSLIPPSSSCTPPSTGTLPNFEMAESSSSGRATPELRSPSKLQPAIRHGCRGENPAMSRSASRVRRHGTSSNHCCSGSSVTAC